MRLFLLIVALVFILGAGPPGLSAGTPSEQQLQAAYLYNFAKFISWPDSAFSDAAAPLVIGVLGKNPFKDELDQLTSRQVRKRPIEIRSFASLKDLDNCQLLYLGPAETKELEAILRELRGRPIVTVGDDKNFAASGGLIQFVTRRGRLNFIINLETAKANGIKIDAQLLSLATDILEAGK